MSPAYDTWRAWSNACLASGHGGGDNLLRIGKEQYVIGEPRELGNGAIVGRMHRFTTSGLSDIGGYKIAADGTVVAWPLEIIREHLEQHATPAHAPALVAEDIQ